MNQSFCVLPWVSVATDTTGDIVPCCVSKQKIQKSDGSAYNLGKDKLEDIYNSKDYIELRRAMLDGELVPGCQECYDNEKYGTSQRLQLNSMYQVVDPKTTTNVEPKYLDIRPGNMCNFRCRSCSPIASSQFTKETNSLQDKGMNQFHGMVPDIDDTWHTTEIFYENLNVVLNSATDIYLTGGEPSIIKSNIDMLQNLVDLGRNTDVKISVSTNLSNTNIKFFELLPNFKNVIIYASVDGCGSIQEYLRYPSKWGQIKTNLEYFVALGDNIQVVVTPVVQITNLNKIVDLLQFVKELNMTYTKKTYVYPINLETPDYLDILYLPKHYKLACYETIRTWLEDYGDESLTSYFDFVKNKANEEVEYTDQLDRFVRYNKLLDNNRNTSLETANPELVEILKEENLW